MAIGRPPLVGNWYVRADRPQAFQVVAIDSRAGTVDIEYFDGTVDEWPLSHWHGLDIRPSEAPRDWTGPFDDVEPDDQGGEEAGRGRDARVRELLSPGLQQIPPARLRATRRAGRRSTKR